MGVTPKESSPAESELYIETLLGPKAPFLVTSTQTWDFCVMYIAPTSEDAPGSMTVRNSVRALAGCFNNVLLAPPWHTIVHFLHRTR